MEGLESLETGRLATVYAFCYPRPREIREIVQGCDMQEPNVRRRRLLTHEFLDWSPGRRGSPGKVVARVQPLLAVIRERLKAGRIAMGERELDAVRDYLDGKFRDYFGWYVRQPDIQNQLKSGTLNAREALLETLVFACMIKSFAVSSERIWERGLNDAETRLTNSPPRHAWPSLAPRTMKKLERLGGPYATLMGRVLRISLDVVRGYVKTPIAP